MLDLTLLSEEQIFGDNRLVIFEKYGTKCAITDFAILLDGYVSSINYTSEGNVPKNRTGWWWTKTPYNNDAHVVDIYGHRNWSDVNGRGGGVRPALSYSSIESISSNTVRGNSGIKEILYGEYPQWVVDEKYSHKLEKSYKKGSLAITGKNYTTDSINCQNTDTSFRARTYTEYEYKGEKFIRIVDNSNYFEQILSDGRKTKIGQAHWLRVEPIIWLVDEKANIALSKYILFAGAQFKNHRDYKGDFESTDIKRFMDNYLLKEIIVNANTLNTGVNIKTNSTDNIDDIFTEAINRMNEINGAPKIKIFK